MGNINPWERFPWISHITLRSWNHFHGLGLLYLHYCTSEFSFCFLSLLLFRISNVRAAHAQKRYLSCPWSNPSIIWRLCFRACPCSTVSIRYLFLIAYFESLGCHSEWYFITAYWLDIMDFFAIFAISDNHWTTVPSQQRSLSGPCVWKLALIRGASSLRPVLMKTFPSEFRQLQHEYSPTLKHDSSSRWCRVSYRGLGMIL